MSDGVSSYRDRHGRTRWRFRHGTNSFSLPGQPGEHAFESALVLARSGRALPTLQRRKSQKRQLSMIENYAAAAIRRARQRAKDKRLPFTLTERDFADLMAAQQFKCAVTGMPFPVEAVSSDREKHAFRPSIDRIAPAKGYTRENVRLVCEMVNFAMSNWGERPLLKMVEFLRVANPTG